MNIGLKLISYNRKILKLNFHAINSGPYFLTNFHSCSKNISLFTRTSLPLSVLRFNRQLMDLASIIKIFEEKVPKYLAESWDNTGLLIEPIKETWVSNILFTNDLTEAVLEEAIAERINLIISYHPPIFTAMKSLKSANWKDRIVMKCIQNSIAVYSPHTSCDAVAGGVNDWLISPFNLSDKRSILPSHELQPKYSYIVDFSSSSGEEICHLIKSIPDSEISGTSGDADNLNFRVKVSKAALNDLLKVLTGSSATSVTVTSLNPLPIPSHGMGRIGTLAEPLPLGDCIKFIKAHLKLEHIRFAQSTSHSLDSLIRTVAVCAGSGSSVLKNVCADLFITGEMSHHDLLDANHRNISVILCEHSNSERGYLELLAESLRPNLVGVNLAVSSSDRDPVDII